MSINNKIIMSSLLGLMTTMLFASEKSASFNSARSSSSEESQFSSYSILIPSFNGALEYVSNSLESLTTTLTNKLSDKAAFQKLGWPSSDKTAEQELQKSKDIYRRVNGFCKNKESYSGYLDDCSALIRRYEYCQRALLALHNNTIVNDSDRVSLALHCLEHHGEVMNIFDKAILKNAVPSIILNTMICRKLGWPPSEKNAEQELQKSKEIYSRVNVFCKNKELYSDYLEDCAAINHISQYCQEILLALYNNTITNHSDRADLALHCLKHHGEIMNVFDKTTFLLFANKDQEQIKHNTEKNDQELASLKIESSEGKS